MPDPAEDIARAIEAVRDECAPEWSPKRAAYNLAAHVARQHSPNRTTGDADE